MEPQASHESSNADDRCNLARAGPCAQSFATDLSRPKHRHSSWVIPYPIGDIPMMEQKLPDDIFGVYICLDTSPSMRWSDGLLPLIGSTRIDMAKSLLRQTLRDIPEGVQVRLITFASRVNRVGDVTGTANLFAAFQAIKAHKRGNTCLYSGVDECIEWTEESQHATVRVIVLTDGGENHSGSAAIQRVKDFLRENGDLDCHGIRLKLQASSFVCIGQSNCSSAAEEANELGFSRFECLTHKNQDDVAKRLQRILQFDEIKEIYKRSRKLNDNAKLQPSRLSFNKIPKINAHNRRIKSYSHQSNQSLI